MGDLRAGLVGYGQMGRHHARVLSALDGVELVGDRRTRCRRTACRELFVHDVEALIRSGLDLAVVAVPTALHEPVGARCLPMPVSTP